MKNGNGKRFGVARLDMAMITVEVVSTLSAVPPGIFRTGDRRALARREKKNC